jgi:hypothetical protein
MGFSGHFYPYNYPMWSASNFCPGVGPFSYISPSSAPVVTIEDSSLNHDSLCKRCNDLIQNMRQARSYYIKRKPVTTQVLFDRTRRIHAIQEEYMCLFPRVVADPNLQMTLIGEFIRTSSTLLPVEKNAMDIETLWHECLSAMSIAAGQNVPLPSSIFISMIQTFTPRGAVFVAPETQEKVKFLAEEYIQSLYRPCLEPMDLRQLNNCYWEATERTRYFPVLHGAAQGIHQIMRDAGHDIQRTDRQERQELNKSKVLNI